MNLSRGLPGPIQNIIEATGIKSAACASGSVKMAPSRRSNAVPQQRPSRERKVTGEVNAHISAIACSEAPEGYKRWTLTLIAAHLVKLEILDSISYESVRQSLKKTLSNPG